MARLFSRQTRKFLKSIWITFNYMLEYVFWCYNVRGDLRAPFRAGFHQNCTIGKLPLVVFSHWVLSWQLSSTGRELTTFVSKKNTSLLPIHKAYTNFFVKLFWFIQPVCFLPSLHLLRWSELRPEDFLVSDWQHLVDSGQAEGVRSSMDGEVCAERSFQAAKWHPQGSFKLISQKGKESGSPLGRAFCPPVMTSSLTWHHLSWCRAPLDSTSSTSPDMKRSWNPKIISKQGLHLRSQVALFGPIEHCAHSVICLSALSKPEMLFIGPHVMPVL